MVEYIQKRVEINDMVEWNNLSYSLDYIDVRIVKMIYYPRSMTLTFNEILIDLNKGKIDPIISKYALRKKLIQLEGDFLIKIVRSKPLVIWPITELSEKNILLLLIRASVNNKMEKIE